jgi:hypothetical protein
VTVLGCASQQDFFALPPAHDLRALRVC